MDECLSHGRSIPLDDPKAPKLLKFKVINYMR